MNSKHSVFTEINVEPTYISTDLVTPGNVRRPTLPSIAVMPRPKAGRFPWGNESMECRSHMITYSNFIPSHFSNATVDSTHNHHGTRVVQMTAIHQPYGVTSLRLSKCRINDQRLPSCNNELIPKSKIAEPLALNPLNRYFSHKSKFQVFPSSDDRAMDANLQELKCKQESKVNKSTSSMKLSKNTLQGISDVNKSVYQTTTNMNDFPNHISVKKSNLKSSISHNEPQKRVSFEENVEFFEVNQVQQNDKICEREVSFDLPEEATSDLSKDVSCDQAKDVSFDLSKENRYDVFYQKSICRFCGKRKKRRVELKYMGENRTVSNTFHNDRKFLEDMSRDASSPVSQHSCWPLGLKNIDESPPSHPKIIIQGHNNRPKGPKNYFDTCQCDQYPQLRDSLLKAEEILERKAANFARRNYTTISVFHKLSPDCSNRNIQTPKRSGYEVVRKKSKKMPRLLDRPLNQKAEAHERFHQKFPESAPDLRDAKKPLRKVMFCGYHSYVFR